MSWYLLMAAIGAYLADGGFRKSEAKPFIYLVYRARWMWKDNTHRMLGISGVIITILGIFFHFTLG
jgi:hypothetical protein